MFIYLIMIGGFIVEKRYIFNNVPCITQSNVYFKILFENEHNENRKIWNKRLVLHY